MTPGPVVVVGCPACGALGSYPTINSGNSFGAIYYTDGYRDAPMMPATPPAFRCGSCRKAFWTHRGKEIGEYDMRDEATVPLEWSKAPALAEPDEPRYLEAMEQLIAADPSRERSLRLRVWWRGNDRHRGRKRQPAPDNPAVVARREANMMALIPLLPPEAAESVLMRAEILRELGQFEEAIRILSGPCAQGLQLARDRIRQLSEEQDRCVRPLR